MKKGQKDGGKTDFTLQAGRDGEASFERGQINLTVCGFHCSATLASPVPSDPRDILNVCLYFFCGETQRWSCIGFLPNTTVSQEGPKSKLL